MMERRGDEVHVETTEASAGSREGVVRWVLIVGTLLAIVLLSAIWMTGAAFQGDREEEATASGRIESGDTRGSDTDSVVSDRIDQVDTAIDPNAAAAQAEPGAQAPDRPDTQDTGQ